MYFFPSRPAAHPTIYAYEDTHPQSRGLLKVGYTSVDVQHRVAQQYPTLRPGARPYRIVFEESAMRGDGTSLPTTRYTACCVEWEGRIPRESGSVVRFARSGRRYAPCGSGVKPNSNARTILPCAPSRRLPWRRPANISVPAVPTTTARRISSGTARCASARPSQPTSWHAAWGGNGCWS